MQRILLKWAGSILLAWSCSFSEVYAQSNDTARKGPSWWTGRPIVTEKEKEERAPPALQYTLAALMTILVLVIACKPSRKRYEG
jgi:hypothetical protein